MKLIFVLLISLCSTTSFGQEFEFNYSKDYERILSQTKDTSSNINYHQLLARFQKNDSTLTDFEVLALLIGFSDHEYFKPYSYLTTENEIYSLNGKGQYQEALAMCDSFLMFVPVSQKALIEKSYAYYKLGDADSAQCYMWKFGKIMDAMGRSGDGQTPESALFSLGPADGQNFIRKYLASGIGAMGSGRDKHGNFVDILEAQWEDADTGEPRSRNVYFQIEHASKTMFDDTIFDRPKKSKRK